MNASVTPTPSVASRKPLRVALAGGLTLGFAAAIASVVGVGGIGNPVDGIALRSSSSTAVSGVPSAMPAPVLRLQVLPRSVSELETVTRQAVVDAVRSGKRLQTGAIMPSKRLLSPSVAPAVRGGKQPRAGVVPSSPKVRPSVVSTSSGDVAQRFIALAAYPPFITLACGGFGYPYVNFSGQSSAPGAVTISYSGPSSGTVLTGTFTVGGNHFFAAALGPLSPGIYTASAQVGAGQSADCTFTIS